jgi:EAL domain-containing protein (putative c-di-GMP-specific phosphodiesterase class I)
LCEALVRCANPDGKLVPTGELVEVAERSALILQLGAWVLDTAADQLAAWAAIPQLGSLGVSINASAIQLRDPDFADQVDTTLVRTGAPPDRITIEVTETALIRNTTLAVETLTRLQSLGIEIAIDDFGSGFTGIAQLRSLPADKLKIDRSLVTDLANLPRQRALVGVIVEAGRQLGLDLVAEGVETRDEELALEDLGVSHMQGWLFARSMPAERIPTFVAEFAKRPKLTQVVV